ncbi:MAG: type II secretion system F family protein [Chloroflexota bacterium]
MGPGLISVMAAVTTAAAVLLLVASRAQPRPIDAVRSRLAQYTPAPRNLREMELDRPFSERVVKPLAAHLASTMGRFTPARSYDEIRKKLVLAGNPNGMVPSDFLGMQGLSLLVMGVFGLVLFVLLRQSSAKAILIVGFFLVFGFLYPRMWLSRKVKTRQRLLKEQLPDSLDLLTIMVEAGLGFDAALARLVDKAQNELSQEFALVLSEVRLGKSRRQALQQLGTRTNVEDIATFVTSLVQADQLGVSIARVLRVQSAQMRIKRRQRAEEAAHKAPIKMLFPLAFLIFPAMFIIILGPAVPGLMHGLAG